VDQEDLLWLNWCRQYLQVTTLSELTTADGCSLTAASLAGQPSEHFVTSYNWPRTRRPGPSHRDLWRRVLSQAVLRPYSRRRRLLQPLGPLEEDHLHVPRCPSDPAKTQWQLLLQELQEWFQSTTTATPIAQFSGPFLAPSAPLTTSLKQRLRGTAYTECLLPPSPKSVRLNSALAPNASSKAFSSTAGPTSSNNSTALAVVADPVTCGLPIYLDSSSLSVKACGSIAMMSFILTTTSSTNSARLLLINASTKSLTWVFATYLGTFALPSNRSRLVEVLRLQLADKEEWVLVISEARRKIRRSLAGRRRLMWELTHPTPRPAAP
ncbi:unnamed protein product, partial [Cylindrotheca closterium]